jgi:hypothetical protein
MAAEPSSLLTEPSDSHVMETVNNFIGFPQYISPSYWLGVAMKKVCGVNPFEWVGEQFAGDWKAIAKASDALKNLAEFNAAYATSLKGQADPLFGSEWSGNAATNADQYFDRLMKLLNDQVAPLNAVARQFNSATVGVLEAADAIKGLLEGLLDMLILLGIELAATAASSWTIVGGIIGGIASAATFWRCVSLWKQIIEAHGLAWQICQVTVGLIAGYLGTLKGLKMQPLPNTSYDHPGV